MGGNATLEYKTKRITKEENEKIINFLLENLNKDKDLSFKDELFGIPLSYSEKESFGDVDLLTTMNLVELLNKISKNSNILIEPKYLAKKRDKNGFRINSQIESIPVKIKTNKFETDFFQLDLILSTKENFDNHLRYLSFNDLGALIGRIAYSQGLRFGESGLYYNFPFEHKFTEILGKTKLFISNDYFKILSMLGFENLPNKEDVKGIEKFNEQFKNKIDIFNFIISNKNFNAEAFSVSTKNSKTKSRDRKRSTVKGFLDFLIEKGYLTKEQAFGDTEKVEEVDRSERIDKGILKIEEFIDKGFIEQNFINCQLAKIKEDLKEAALRKNFNKKFSGDVVIDLMNEKFKEDYDLLKPKELASIVSRLKTFMLDYFNERNLTKEQVLDLPEEEIRNKLIELLEKQFEKKKIVKVKHLN
jgi:hypothetical protein